MKSQGMIANESIFADEGQELKHPDPDPDKVGAGAGHREHRGGTADPGSVTRETEKRRPEGFPTGSGRGRDAALSSRRTPKTEGKQQIPSDRVGTRKDRSSPRKHLRSAKTVPCARDDTAETRRTQRRAWVHKFAGEWGAVGAWILRCAQNDQNTTCRGNFARKGAS